MKQPKRPERRIKPIQIRLEPSLYQFLRRYVAEQHTTVSQLFRDFIVRLKAGKQR